jgi:large subunit ribosomal protein L29
MRDSFNDLTYDELITKKDELVRRHREIRFGKVVGHLENPLELRTIRRKLARLNTIIHEYHLRIRGGNQ